MIAIFKTLLLIAKTNIKIFRQVSKIFNFKASNLYRALLKEPNKVADLISKLTLQQLKKLEGTFNLFDKLQKIKRETVNNIKEGVEKRKAIYEIDQKKVKPETKMLSSSWLRKGTFIPSTASGYTGSLTIVTKQGKSYTYYNVSSYTWEEMKLAKGRNGTGAGSVFWIRHLRNYHDNPLKQLVNLARKQGQIQSIFNQQQQ